MRDKDIAVRRLVQPIDDVVTDALVERNQRALIRLHADIEASECRDLPGPTARDIDENIARIFRDDARKGIARADALDLAAAEQRHLGLADPDQASQIHPDVQHQFVPRQNYGLPYNGGLAPTFVR